MTKNKFMYAFVFLSAALFTWGCGTTAHVQKVPGVELDNYKTFSWLENDKKDGASYKNFEEAYLKQTIAEQLKKKGYREVKASGDLSIDYDVMVETGEYTKSQPVYSQPTIGYRFNPYTRRMVQVYYPSQYLGSDNYQVPYKSGTITVNLVDNKTNEVAWQGWAETDLDRKKLSSNEIDGAVGAIFRKFKK
ncbi:MAG: hypothetical protein JWQ27_424 [Ferruginibacter sp.]|nr:hypothetical protein [Ferruginibacter sp.]